MKISLSNDIIEYIDAQIESGRGLSRSDVILRAILYQKFRDELRADVVQRSVDATVKEIVHFSKSHEFRNAIKELIREEIEGLKKPYGVVPHSDHYAPTQEQK